MKLCLLASICLAAAVGAVQTSGKQDYNVILICLDTLRADRLGSLGNRHRLTPSLDAVAASSYLFTNAVSQSAWTLPSMMSVFTSLYPHQHNVLNKFAVFTKERKELARLPRRFSTLAQIFQRNGYATAAFTGDAGVEGNFGFDSGFEVYFDSITFGGFETTFPMALRWIESHSDKKFFLFVHGYDVHGQFLGGPKDFLELRMRTIQGKPIRLSPRQVQGWRNWYDGKVAKADERFGGFWRSFSALPAAKKTVVVILADHGEQLYEHGGFDHGMTLYDETLRVPLILHAPDSPGVRIDGQVRLIDVMPTLADWLGLDIDTSTRRQMQGVSLMSLMRGEALSLDAYSETSFLLSTEKRSLRASNGWKLIYDLESLAPELYDLRHDPAEKRNLAAKKAATVEEMSRKLFNWSESRAPIPP